MNRPPPPQPPMILLHHQKIYPYHQHLHLWIQIHLVRIPHYSMFTHRCVDTKHKKTLHFLQSDRRIVMKQDESGIWCFRSRTIYVTPFEMTQFAEQHARMRHLEKFKLFVQVSPNKLMVARLMHISKSTSVTSSYTNCQLLFLCCAPVETESFLLTDLVENHKSPAERPSIAFYSNIQV